MSVPAYRRKESPMEFISNARDLLKLTRSICTKKLPKQYTFYGGIKIYDAAEAIFKDVIKANETDLFKQFDLREYYLNDALAELEYLSGRISILMDDRQPKEDEKETYWTRWGTLISVEKSLILGVISKDKERIQKGA